MRDSFTRRSLLRASTATAVGLGGMGTASASTGETGVLRDEDDLDAERIPRLDLSDVELRTTSASLPLPEQAHGIRPGSQMFIEFEEFTAGCTANFVWRDARSGALYIGAAGHCFLPADVSASRKAATAEEKRNGDAFSTKDLTVSVCADCTYGGLTGLAVVEGDVIELGDVVYARQVEANGDGHVGHDFGLVRIPRDAEDLVDPSLPQFGGPDGVSPDAISEGHPINQYGAGVANGEIYPTMGSTGVSEGDAGTPESWFAAIRASPGDSGSPIIGSHTDGGTDDDGKAGGILTHLTTLGIGGTTMQQCKDMVERDINKVIEVVVPGDE